jgi:putative phosphonate metabolism protein
MNMDIEIAHPHRVAIYYAPAPQSDWWQAGSGWLGRCARTGQALAQPAIRGISPELQARLTADPRRYGWHATLKAPFSLATGQTLESLRVALRRLCEGRAPFELAPLQVCRMDSFLALRPDRQQAELERLASDCVQHLQPLARPLSDAELARRRRAALTPEQDALLQAWGYPYVLEHFRFHLSLTGPLDALSPEQIGSLIEAASIRFHALPAPRIDGLSIFVEPTPGADFQWLEQIDFQP